MDLSVAGGFFLLGLVLAFAGSAMIEPVVTEWNAGNVWFEADIPRVFRNMISRWSNHYRVKVHPLYSLMSYPPVWVIRRFVNSPWDAVRIVSSAIAGLWLMATFAVLRLTKLRILDAALFTVLAAVSAAAFFWTTVPETYAWGSLSLLLVMGFAALSDRREFSRISYVGISIVSLSATITNWMAGIAVSFTNLSLRRTIRVTLDALLVTTLLWTVQKVWFPSARFFLGDREEAKYLVKESSGFMWEKIQAFLLHSMVMPEIRFLDQSTHPEWSLMSIQDSLPGTGTTWGFIPVVLWVGLVAAGILAGLQLRDGRRHRTVLGVTLAGQLLLHSFYGEETFLYSLHWLPLLVLVASFGARTRFRPLILVMAVGLTALACVNNFQQFRVATDYLSTHGSERQKVIAAKRLRPSDPWPRGEGHVVLAVPGSAANQKAYHEPGGGFSPGVSTFGISIWLMNSENEVVETSDTIPLADIRQSFLVEGDSTVSVLTTTPYYQAKWSCQGIDSWELQFKGEALSELYPVIVVRSVGPAGGPVESLDWQDGNLLVNSSWNIEVDPQPRQVFTGGESDEGWPLGTRAGPPWLSEDGWGFARFEFPADTAVALRLTSGISTDDSSASEFGFLPSLALDLPDQRFVESLEAQLLHLKMGLVDAETRPGDPTSYPLAWLRDGAYVVVAMARSGELALARKLVEDFATQDFFGGFGAEADSPGLAIWALEEVSIRLADRGFDEEIWPHVLRKAELILEMLDATESLHKDFRGPVVPIHADKSWTELTLVAERAQDGLIVGKMDHGFQLFFVNSVSYMGLVKAAAIATRIGRSEEAALWRATAGDIKKSWLRELRTHPDRDNPRTAISGLWPTGISTANPRYYRDLLEERRSERRDLDGGFKARPLWTYFDVAEAHQWLRLEEPEWTWSTLDWFWANQTSPGLYSWWEGAGEGNSFPGWRSVRGWTSPQHITPHYWTAAEMALLQMEMLAFEDFQATGSTVIIGAGIPKDWLATRMSVQGLLLGSGRIDWMWDPARQELMIGGESSPMAVRLGRNFPEDAQIVWEQALDLDTSRAPLNSQ